MTFKLGSTSINDLRLGSAEIKKAYLGSTLIHDTTGGGGGGLPVAALFDFNPEVDTFVQSAAPDVDEWTSGGSTPLTLTNTAGNNYAELTTAGGTDANYVFSPTTLQRDRLYSGAAAFSLNSGAMTLFVVAGPHVAASELGFVNFIDSVGGGFLNVALATSGKIHPRVGDGTTTASPTFSSLPDVAIGEYQLCVGVYDKTGNDVEAWFNDSTTSMHRVNFTPAAVTLDQLKFISEGETRLVRLVVYDSVLSQTDREAVQAYLYGLYGPSGSGLLP